MLEDTSRFIIINVLCSELPTEFEQNLLVSAVLKEKGLPAYKRKEVLEVSPELVIHFLEHSPHHGIEIAVMFGVVQ